MLKLYYCSKSLFGISEPFCGKDPQDAAKMASLYYYGDAYLNNNGASYVDIYVETLPLIRRKIRVAMSYPERRCLGEPSDGHHVWKHIPGLCADGVQVCLKCGEYRHTVRAKGADPLVVKYVPPDPKISLEMIKDLFYCSECL